MTRAQSKRLEENDVSEKVRDEAEEGQDKTDDGMQASEETSVHDLLINR